MGPILVIIGPVIGQNLAEVLLIEDNDVVQTFAANRANYPFDHWILPRRSRGDELLFQPQALDSVHKIRAIDSISIAEKITRRDSVGESFDYLLSRPKSRGRFGDIEMQDFATLMGEDQKDIQHTEGGGRYGKEIHCNQCLGMVLKEGLPSLS